jgi:hypothetical protein
MNVKAHITPKILSAAIILICTVSAEARKAKAARVTYNLTDITDYSNIKNTQTEKHTLLFVNNKR